MGPLASETRDARLRAVIADDDPYARKMIKDVMEQAGLIVIAEARNGREAVELTLQHHPDVVVMDLQMPVLNGIDATRKLAETLPDVRVLVFTMGEEDGTVLAAMRAGARGYLVKGASQEEVVRAISTVHAGGLVFGASLALRIADLLSGSTTPDRSAFPQLTEREVEILDLIAAGRNNAQIASSLYLAPKTVRNNVSNILAKLQATDRAEAIIRARDAGLGGA